MNFWLLQATGLAIPVLHGMETGAAALRAVETVTGAPDLRGPILRLKVRGPQIPRFQAPLPQAPGRLRAAKAVPRREGRKVFRRRGARPLEAKGEGPKVLDPAVFEARMTVTGIHRDSRVPGLTAVQDLPNRAMTGKRTRGITGPKEALPDLFKAVAGIGLTSDRIGIGAGDPAPLRSVTAAAAGLRGTRKATQAFHAVTVPDPPDLPAQDLRTRPTRLRIFCSAGSKSRIRKRTRNLTCSFSTLKIRPHRS